MPDCVNIYCVSTEEYFFTSPSRLKIRKPEGSKVEQLLQSERENSGENFEKSSKERCRILICKERKRFALFAKHSLTVTAVCSPSIYIIKKAQGKYANGDIKIFII